MFVHFKGSTPRRGLTPKEQLVLGALPEPTTAASLHKALKIRTATLSCCLQEMRERKLVEVRGKVKLGNNSVYLWARTERGTQMLQAAGASA